ncbi:MAG: glycosyltransferase 87 family protein, partial [Candidatus Krumholzibacteriia bacterium]
ELGIGATALLMRRQTERLGMKERRFYWIVLAAFVPAALNSTSVHNDVRAGSVGIVLYLALVLVAWGMMSRTSWLTGAAVALAALVKLAPAVAVLYVARRGARRAALLAAVLLVVSMLPALLHWGWGIVPDYLQSALLPSLGAEHPRPMNQSLDAMLSRLFIPSPLVRSPFDLPWLKHALSASLSIVILVLTLGTLRARRRHVALLPVELGLVILAVLILMKLTWVHTLAAMLFVWPFLMLAILRAAERSAAWAVRAGVWACIGFFLSSAHVPILWQGLRHGPWVLVISVHLLGLLILWAVSRQVLRHQADFLS